MKATENETEGGIGLVQVIIITAVSLILIVAMIPAMIAGL